MRYFYDNILEAVLAQDFGIRFEGDIILGIRNIAVALSAQTNIKYYIAKDLEWIAAPQQNDWVEYEYSGYNYFGQMLGKDDGGWIRMIVGKGQHFIKSDNVIGVIKRNGRRFIAPKMEKNDVNR